MSRARRAVLLVAALASPAAADDRGEAHAGLLVFAQPVSSSSLVVITPSVSAQVAPIKWLVLDVGWAMDVVTGATPRTYGPPDVVSAATQFSEVRNVLAAGAAVHLGAATVEGGYSYGIESDYRTQLVRAGASYDLFGHNTVVAASYGHSFSRICDLDQAALPVTLRQPLDNSRGCFGPTPGLATESLDTDAAELSLTQTLTPQLVGALVGTYEHLSGFQSSPYRRVSLLGGMFQPQESHPRLRDRGAITARLRYAVARLRASLGFDLRLYRDTWGVQSITASVEWQQPLRRSSPAWRFAARARGYLQSGAFFFRDASEASSYDATGPVGSYFTADQELAPLADLLVGLRALHTTARAEGQRVWHAFTNLDVSLGVDYLKIFALTPDPPNADRAHAPATALVLTLSLTGRF